jgi:hypothetical protein
MTGGRSKRDRGPPAGEADDSGAAAVRTGRLGSAAVSALSAGLGEGVLDPAQALSGALVDAFAAGALLAMVAGTLLPEAYDVEGVLTGPLVVAALRPASRCPRCDGARPAGIEPATKCLEAVKVGTLCAAVSPQASDLDVQACCPQLSGH